MLSMILVAVVVCHEVAGSGDWPAEMFPSDASPDDAVYFPEADGCKFVICVANQFFVYGNECSRVPEYPGQPATSMNILATNIETIGENAFQSWEHLRSLSINMNTGLKKIEGGAFSPLASLTNLTISNNYNLRTLPPDVFLGLNSLQELRLIKNNIKSIFSITLASRPFVLPSLKYLDLSDNPFQALTRENFAEMDGSALDTLTLRLCGLYAIEPNTFSWFTELKVLNLDNNKLSTETLSKLVINLNKTAPLLRHFGIGSNFLNKNPYEFFSLVAQTNISSIDLKENHFDFAIPSSLEGSPFPFMPNIRELDLSAVSGYELQPGTFSPSLPNLQRLVLAKNRLPGLLPGLRLSSLLELDLSENVCENCLVKPHFEIEDDSLANMVSLQDLTLSNNYLYQISRFMFTGLYSLRNLYLSNCSIFHIVEFSFENLTSLEYLDLSHNKLTKRDALPGSVFYGLTNLTSLRLDSCDISSFFEREMFMFLPKLEYLTLKDNKLAKLVSLQFTPLPNLEILDVSNNGLLPWTERLFSNNYKLREIIMNSNHIYKFTNEMIEDVAGLEVLKLRSNPFSCTCALVNAFQDTGADYMKNSFGINDPAVKCYLPKPWIEQRVTDYLSMSSGSYECLPWALIGAAIGAFFLLTLIACLVAAYYLRWYIRYWMFLFRQKWRSSFPGKKLSSTRGKYKYDAFVSYCNEDRNFVIRLVAMLENYDPYYRLCVFERDFKAGDIISQSVVDCLSSSRKSILILTDAFARSQWCQWELQMAHHKRIFFKQEGHEDSLILVKLGDVMDAHMTPTLRYLMKTRVYLQWHSDPKRQRIFWHKLRDALRPSLSDIISV
nr:chaoptin-like [Halyomorpha halys]